MYSAGLSAGSEEEEEEEGIDAAEGERAKATASPVREAPKAEEREDVSSACLSSVPSLISFHFPFQLGDSEEDSTDWGMTESSSSESEEEGEKGGGFIYTAAYFLKK